jgi:hypothetical protein
MRNFPNSFFKNLKDVFYCRWVGKALRESYQRGHQIQSKQRRHQKKNRLEKVPDRE